MSQVSLKELRSRFGAPGVLRWIGVRPAQGAPMTVLDEVQVLAPRGLAGDLNAQRRAGLVQLRAQLARSRWRCTSRCCR